MLRISCLFFALKIALSAVVSTVPMFFAIQIVQMFGWGIMSSGIVYYVNEIVGDHDKAQGQADRIDTVLGRLDRHRFREAVMLNYKLVDISDRKAHFDYFMSVDKPHAEVTADVDVSRVVSFCDEKGYPFFLTCLHIFARAAESVPELRRRIHVLAGEAGSDESYLYEIREYEKTPTSHTEQSGKNTYCYCTIHHDKPFENYIEEAKTAQITARNNDSIEEDDDVEGYLFASCLPWIHYRSLSNPTNGVTDSNPRITWGKYEEDHKGRLMMPVTLAVHHGLVDGIHIADFFNHIPEIISEVIGEK